MTFTLPESLWLHGHGFDDLLLAYPTADRGALAELARLDTERPPILMVDSVEHLDYIEAAVGAPAGPIRVCLELDTGWWPLGGRLKVGAKRSPVRTPEQAQALAREIVGRPGFELAALMGYEAHIAGVGDRPLDKRLQGAADPGHEAALRRGAGRAPRGRRGGGPGGRARADRQRRRHGQRPRPRREAVITEVTAGSGFFAPLLFDRYATSRCARGDVRDAGGAPAERRRGHPAGRRLPASGGGGRVACRLPTCRAACGLTPRRARARCRRP